MITIYNETSAPWAVKKYKEDILCLTKVKEKLDATKKKKISSISLVTHTNIYNGGESTDDKITMLQDCIHMTEPKVIGETKTAVSFSKKHSSPFVVWNRNDIHADKHTLLISINLKGRRIVNVCGSNYSILDFLMVGGEFSMIVTLNKPDSDIKIYLSPDSTKIESYSFNVKGEMVTSVFDDAKLAKSQLKIRKYRPDRPTHAIINYNQPTSILDKLINRENHKVVLCSHDDIDSAIKEVRGEKYTAVTIFAGDVRLENSIINTLKATFNVISVMNNQGKLSILKI